MANFETIVNILFDITKYQLAMIAIFFAILIGLWTMNTTLADVLLAKTEIKTATFWCWFFLIFWLFFFLATIVKVRKSHLERLAKAKNDELEDQEKKNEKQQNAKNQNDRVAFQNEVKEKGVKITEDQIKIIKENTESKIKTAQENTESQIQKDLSDRDAIIAQQMETLESSIDQAIKDLERETKWYHHLANFFLNIYQFSASNESISRAKSFSSSSL